jgi:hypothetical protein
MTELQPTSPVYTSDDEPLVADEIVESPAKPPVVAAQLNPPARRPDTLQHAIFLALAVGVVIASFTFGVGQSKKVTLPGLGVSLPSVCQFKNATGLDCPGCGLSRAFIHLAHGDPRGAWRYNPAAALVFVFVVAQIPYRSIQLWRIRRGQGELNWRRVGNWAIGILAVALLSQWLVKLAWWVIG